MKIATERYNPYVPIVENAQSDIRELMKDAYMTSMLRSDVERKLAKIIAKAVKDISIDRLKRDIRLSLINFANAQRRTWQKNVSPELFVFLGAAKETSEPQIVPLQLQAEMTAYCPNDPLTYTTSEYGVPLQQFYQDVWKQHVQPVMDKLASEQALDPNDFTGRNSLRNLAEMEVRYHDHEDNIENLRSSGVRLVVCSSHADCSDRCAQWQGRVYSLDGTSGTVDGHRYVPLETATDVYYTTRAGRVYKNGLLGFNCRHYLQEYRGQLLPNISAQERKKEYKITERQRKLERAVRETKVKALNAKGINAREYAQYTKCARQLYERYKQFSVDNNRAYYPMRVRI